MPNCPYKGFENLVLSIVEYRLDLTVSTSFAFSNNVIHTWFVCDNMYHDLGQIWIFNISNEDSIAEAMQLWNK